MKQVATTGRNILLSLSLIISGSLHAQQNGLIVKNYPVNEGTIYVYLPPISSSITISGSVVADPSGNSEKERNRNADILKKYQLTVGQKILSVGDKIFSLQIPGAASALTLELKDDRGKSVKKEDIPCAKQAIPQSGFNPPAYIVAGDPARIKGNFDGNASNTTVNINGKQAEILAESPGATFFKAPEDVKGKAQLDCTENGKSQTTKINALRLDLTADKLNLQKGESTQIHVKVSGLEGLEEPVPLTIINQSNATITLQGGNAQEIIIDPATTGTSGIYETSRGVQSMKTGNFTISASIPQPEDSTGTGMNTAVLCNCYIDYNSYLLPPQTCKTLGGVCGSAMPTAPETTNATNPPSNPATTISVPKSEDTKTGKIELQLNASTDNIVAVNFSEKPAGGKQWTNAGTAVKKGNNWEYGWTAPLGNDGIHTVRARVVSKDNVVTEKFIQTTVALTPLALSPGPNERFNLSVSEAQVKEAEQKARDAARRLQEEQEKIAQLEKQQQELNQQAAEKREMANELSVIDKTLEQIPSLYRDSLKALTDSLKKLQAGLPPKPDPAALQQNADDAAQRLKDCLDRLEKLKQEKEALEKERDDLKKQTDALLDQMDQLHLGNGWIGGHGYHPNGLLWFGYVGDESSNTGITAQSRALEKQMRPLNKAYMNALKRLKNLDKEIADAEKDCEKLKKESENAAQAAQNSNAAQAVSGQIGELARQIQSLVDALRQWCAAHPGVCKFDLGLAGLPEDIMGKVDDLIAKKQQLEKDLEKSAAEDAANAQSTGAAADAEKDKAGALEDEKNKAEAAANALRIEREKQLEAERAKQRKKDEENKAGGSNPNPQPTLPEPVNPEDDQLKFQAQRVFRNLYQDNLVNRGPCDCRTKALAFANNTNSIVGDLIGRIGVGVAFAPFEVLPGISFGAKLGIGAAKALASALFGGQSFSEELGKNLFSAIGGEIFPKLTGDKIAGELAKTLANGGLNEVLKAEGIRSISWEGETELRNCGKVKGKTVMLFNPNTGWVVIMIKIDNCPLVVIKYKVNKDGVPVTNPTVQTVNG